MSNLLSKASILLTPTATSDGKLHNVKPNTTSGDFTFTRGTAATRVNSSGLIESVASGLPRIDFLGGTGQVLLEPSSTNTATYSNDLTQGDIFNGSNNPSLDNATLTANQGTAPDGTNNSWLFKDNNDGGTGTSRFSYFGTNVTSGNFNTFSIFVKKSLSNNFIRINAFAFDTTLGAWFNIQDGILGTVQSGLTAKIDDYGNGWYRCQITNQTTTDLVGYFEVQLQTSDGGENITRDGTNGVLLFGVQAESDASRNFATSYIPTSGGSVTRNKDQANSSGDTSLINSTEGVLYAEIAALANSGNSRFICLSDGTNQNVVILGYISTDDRIRIFIKSSNSTQANNTSTTVTATNFNKIAVKYKQNDFALFVNGTETFSDTLGLAPIGLNELEFEFGSGSLFEGKIKTVAVFKEALTDAQLISLTS